MLFAAWDFIQYKLRLRHYGTSRQNLMSLGHLGGVPKETVNLLQESDLILTQKLDSALSWAMMYFTGSSVDHLAVYVGNGRILHMTLNGGKHHLLNVFGKNTRVLPIRLNVDQLPKTVESAAPQKMRGHYSWTSSPPKIQLLIIGLRLILGLHPSRFRWKFFLDLIILLALVDAAFFLFFHKIMASYFVLFALATITINQIVYKVQLGRGHPPEFFSHPDILLNVLSRVGGTIFSNKGALPVLGVDTILATSEASVSRQSTDHSSKD